jgi:hypothetical protein
MLRVHIDWPDEIEVRHRADITTLVRTYCEVCDEENVPDSIAYDRLSNALEQCGLDHTIVIDEEEDI